MEEKEDMIAYLESKRVLILIVMEDTHGDKMKYFYWETEAGWS